MLAFAITVLALKLADMWLLNSSSPETLGLRQSTRCSFYATWCGPCLLLAKELEQVPSAHPLVPLACPGGPNNTWQEVLFVVQVYEALGDSIRIVKVDTDENPDLSSQLQVCVYWQPGVRSSCTCLASACTLNTSHVRVSAQIQGLPTMVFVGLDRSKPALRTEGLLPAETIMVCVLILTPRRVRQALVQEPTAKHAVCRAQDIIRTELMEEQTIDVGAAAGVADVE